MTTDQLSKLTPEQRRENIAVACGALWTKTHDYRQEYTWTAQENATAESYHPKELLCFHYPEGKRPVLPICHRQDGRVLGFDIPDYLNDLNAMHKAEEMLHKDFKKSSTYAGCLLQIVRSTKHSGIGEDFAVLNASATQRAEAFLLTVS